jgi:hypothetical protein
MCWTRRSTPLNPPRMPAPALFCNRVVGWPGVVRAYGFGFAWLRIASSGDGGRGSGVS